MRQSKGVQRGVLSRKQSGVCVFVELLGRGGWQWKRGLTPIPSLFVFVFSFYVIMCSLFLGRRSFVQH